MKDVWKTRLSNLERIASVQNNFSFILSQIGDITYHSNQTEGYIENKDISEARFQEELKKYKELTNPKTGDIITLEDNFLTKTIVYAGILMNPEEMTILSKEYGESTINTIDEIMEKYCHPGREITKIEINAYNTDI